MRKLLFPLAGGIGVVLAACLAAPGEPIANSANPLSCNANERAFNGACRPICTTSAQCGSPNTCMTVSAGVSLCIDYSACAYLGSDSECSGVPYASSTTYDPYWIPNYTPYAAPNSAYPTEPFGCGGNAVWHSAPPAAGDDPRCGEAHPVVRCQKVGKACSLVAGTTMDVADR